MSTELMRFAMPVTPASLPRVLLDHDALRAESLGISVDLSGVSAVVAQFRQDASRTDDEENSGGLLGSIFGGNRRSRNRNRQRKSRAFWDREMVEPLHSALRYLPHRVATDMRFWHWMCIGPFAEFVWLRWADPIPEQSPEQISPAMAGRFLGNPTLNGVSRNALARLWWCGQALYSQEEGYTLAKQVLSNQDLFQAIFEREFGLYPQAARAVLHFVNTGEEPHRLVAKRLNHYLTTVAVETLEEKEIVELLST